MAGRKINDHSFFAGRSSADSVLPKGVHTKQYTSAEGAGELNKYEDTSEEIRAAQVEGGKQIRSKPMKQPGYRY